jgi:polyphenol oxidase
MHIIKSSLFEKYHNLIFGFSTKIGLNRTSPFDFNMSYTVGDNPDKVKINREAFFNELGTTTSQVALQKQIHSDIISIIDKPGLIGESDAMITTLPNIGLAISSADCVPIFIYDKKNKLIAAVHSGWRGTKNQILKKTIESLFNRFNSKPENLIIYIGPSISQENYEVGEDVAKQFDEKYLMILEDKIFLDVQKANIDMLWNAGINEVQIERSSLCSFREKDLLHSYRRDGRNSGRALGLLVIKS